MFDLLKASLRERPDYIIVGEVRGQEAAILFQGMATGHAGLGTVHAEKFNDLVNRMTIPPINMPKPLLTELDIVIFMKQLKVKANLVRRASSVVEIIDYDSQKDKFLTNELVTFNPADDTFKFKQTSAVISKLIEMRGGKETAVWTEIEKRRRILELLHTYKILEFGEVTTIIKAYYQNPAEIFNYIDTYVKKRTSVPEEKK
jgi:flagellar protein FlaI